MRPPTITPGLDYTVLPRHSACLSCRKRKQKCDANKPACQECVAGSRECQYEDETYRTRTQALQDKIRDLEAQIRAAEEKQGASHLSAPISQGSSNGSEGQSHAPSSVSSRSPPSNGGSNPPAPSARNSDGVDQTSFPPTLSSSGLAPGSLGSDLPWPEPNVTKKLLDIFLQRHAQCGFELHIGRVMQSLQPGAPQPMIPTLFNAMLLMGCYFAQDDSLKAWESTFFERTKLEIEANITRAHGGEGKYNPLYHLQAMIMLGAYYYFKGRLLEGHVHTSQATRFAVALGVHQLNSRIFHPDKVANKVNQVSGTERWYPRDSVELGEAINVWWSCSTWDTDGSTLNGLPPSLSFEEITTVWPRPLSDFESGNILPDDDYSVAALLDPALSFSVADASEDNVKALLAKANVLLQCAAKLDTERISDPKGTPEWWSMFERCDQSVNRFMKTMPAVHLARNIEELACFVLVHTSIYCGIVQLHSALAEYELALGTRGDPRCLHPDGTLGGLSYDRCSEACHATSLAAVFVADMDMSYMHLFIGISWVCVSETVARSVPRLRQSGRNAQAEEKERQAEVVEKCMEKLVATYPVLQLQVEHLRMVKREQLQKLTRGG